jgi:hypothetical protein
MVHLPHIKGKNIESGHRYVELDLEPIMIAVAELNSCKLSSLMICYCLSHSVCFSRRYYETRWYEHVSFIV